MSRRDILKILVIVLVLAGCVLLVEWITRSEDSAETEIVRRSIRQAAINCYAVEGAYPDSLDYLRENYFLAYNEDLYLVTYNAFSSNHIPDIYVTERGAGLP